MGNTSTKEARGGPGSPHTVSIHVGGGSSGAGHHDASADRSRRVSTRPDLASITVLTGTSSSRRDRGDAPFERRETKQEREARRLEKEQVARIKERERSMREEHVDGGYLVTMGVYTASEDFNKQIVRQLQIDRRLAPFWRGLDDFRDDWAEHQIIAAARGLPIPPADEVPEGLVPQARPPMDSPRDSTQNTNSLTVPMGPRTLSTGSAKTGRSIPGSPSLPTPTSTPARVSSPLKASKALAAALSISSRNGSHQDIARREITMPPDPFVNGQPLEVFLYKDGNECPICCMYYPRYLNKTRCCDQFICSECFVQIKRPDPHLPEHHVDAQHDAPGSPSSDTLPDTSNGEDPDELIMEPACCPYCTQTEFGVTYEPPPFRRGLIYATQPGVGTLNTAMSSTSSLNSANLAPSSAIAPAAPGRRRAQSLSVNAPGVISTDRIRPDWSTKLAAARAQQRRRAAAADALHHAAFMMNSVSNMSEGSRSLFSRSGRFSRRSTVTNGQGGSESPGTGAPSGSRDDPAPERGAPGNHHGRERERIFDARHLESLMMAEAIRLSLADEEERRKKAEKEAKKEAKKKEKEERKAAKKRASVYGYDGGSSASVSTLSLGLGRRRGNSTSLRMEASVAAANKTVNQSNEMLAKSAPTETDVAADKGKGVDRGEQNVEAGPSQQQNLSPTSVPSLPIPDAAASQRPRSYSHLRQMSNASSVDSSDMDSLAGSYGQKRLGGALDPRTSGLSLAKSDDEDTANESGPQSMFNFRSLAEMVGVDVDGSTAPEHGESGKEGAAHVEHVEATTPPSASTSPSPLRITTTANDGFSMNGTTQSKESTSQAMNGSPLEAGGGSNEPQETSGDGSQVYLTPPSLTVTPVTPGVEDDCKQLGHTSSVERASEITQ